MFRSKIHKHLNVQRHHDAGHMMRIAAFTVISCFVASSCSIVNSTAKRAPIVSSPDEAVLTATDTTRPAASLSDHDTVPIAGTHHVLPLADGLSSAPAAEPEVTDPLATTVLATSTTKAESKKAEGQKKEATKASNSKAGKHSKSSNSKAASTKSKHDKHHRTKKSKAKHSSSEKHGKAKHATPQHEKHKKSKKSHKSSSSKGRTKAKPDKSSKHNRHSKSGKHSKASKDSTEKAKSSTDNANSSTDKAPSTTSAPADAPIIVPEAAVADADTGADPTGLSQAGTDDSFPDGAGESAATEPENLNNAAQEKQQKLDKMLTTTTYIAIIAFLLALLLYFKRAMREIKNTQRLANEARAIAKDAQNIAEQQSSSPAPAGQGTPAVDRRATDALKQAQERTQQKVDQLQNILTDVRASLGGLIRQTTGHEEALSLLKNDVGDTKQEVNETRQLLDNAQQQIIDNSRQTEATKERLDATAQSLAAATQNIEAIADELAKFKAEFAECQTAISQLNSTHKPSRKTATPTIFEHDLFAENSHETQPTDPSSDFSPSPATTAAAEGIAPPAVAAVPVVAAPPVTEASAEVGAFTLDLEKAKKDPVGYAANLAARSPSFFNNMNQQGAALTKRDRALSTLIALGVERENLQDIFGLTRESLKAARYRIRTKLQLERRDNLDDYLKNWL